MYIIYITILLLYNVCDSVPKGEHENQTIKTRNTCHCTIHNQFPQRSNPTEVLLAIVLLIILMGKSKYFTAEHFLH